MHSSRRETCKQELTSVYPQKLREEQLGPRNSLIGLNSRRRGEKSPMTAKLLKHFFSFNTKTNEGERDGDRDRDRERG